MSDKLTFSLHGLRPANSWCSHLQEGEIFRNKTTGFPKLLLTINGEFHRWLLENLQGKFPSYSEIQTVIVYSALHYAQDMPPRAVQVFQFAGEEVYLFKQIKGCKEHWVAYLKPGYCLQVTSNLKSVHYNREDCILRMIYKLAMNFKSLQEQRNRAFETRIGWNPETKEINQAFYDKIRKIDVEKLVKSCQ
jgi:hypothetical protein